MLQKGMLVNIFKYLKEYLRKIIVIIICMIAVSVLGMVTPLIQEDLFDNGIMSNNMKGVLYYTLLLIVVFLLQRILEFIQFVQSEYINKQLPYQLLRKTICHSLNMKIAYYKDNNFSKIINNTYMDITSITQIVNTSILQSLVSVFKIIGGTIGLLIINWKLAVFVLAVVPAEIIASSIFVKKRQDINKLLMKLNENFAIWFSETFNSIEILKLWNLQEKRKLEFDRLQHEIMQNETRVDYIDHYSDILSSVVNILFNYGLNLLGAYFIFANELTIGGLFAFASYSIYVMQPISILANIIYKFTSNYPAFERFIKYFDNEIENNEGLELQDNFTEITSISFNQVIFGYDKKESVLDQVSFEIKRGEKVAFVGYNGCGKSTILQLLLRFFEPRSGNICINDVDIQNIKLSDYRKLFSVMNQNLFLFEGSIKNNINIEDDFLDKEIEEYLELLNLTECVDLLPKGIDTNVGYNGTKLSGGEKQKIVLARTLCRKAPILVLDEVTASFDIETEMKFDEYISRCKQYEIILVVSHRIDILKKMDKIFILDKGKIVDSGNFEELESRGVDLISIVEKGNEDECSN